jgi:two-component system, OmpR family, response regulator RegX3
MQSGYSISNSMRVALLENDRPHAELLDDWLSFAGHRCIRHAQTQALVRALRHENFDVLILDTNFSDNRGIGVLKDVRCDLRSSIPVLFVSARNGENDIVTALEQGADDCMVRPVRRMELLARLEAIRRRGMLESQPQEVFDLGPLRVDCQTRTAWFGNAPVHLTVKDFDLCVLFLRNVGRLLSRGRIREAVWGSNVAVASRSLDTHICRIRNRLRLTPRHGWRLSAVYGCGYCLRRCAVSTGNAAGAAEPSITLRSQLRAGMAFAAAVQPVQPIRK